MALIYGSTLGLPYYSGGAELHASLASYGGGLVEDRSRDGPAGGQGHRHGHKRETLFKLGCGLRLHGGWTDAHLQLDIRERWYFIFRSARLTVWWVVLAASPEGLVALRFRRLSESRCVGRFTPNSSRKPPVYPFPLFPLSSGTHISLSKLSARA